MKDTIYIYVDGNDNLAIEERIINSLESFVSDRKWRCPKAWVVNQKVEAGGDEFDWDLGLNIDLPDRGNEPEGWFEDIKQAVEYCTQLYLDFGCEFAIGISDNVRGITEDIIYIDSGSPDIAYLKDFIG